jgi:xylose isomerase
LSSNPPFPHTRIPVQAQTGVKLLWGTQNMFSHKRYMNGAATNPDAHVFAYAAAQTKKVE